ncbi:hypothetical protein BJ138DRAFT_1079491 [Hygrophoropsis aurantiaca]|uniref:Uncharacterized protein n=1 Tax=Hygrophoropsis aurantiaca TaxID=72124 RepID=A0ACB8AM65_9AGAM|nr:hypothetical protein BJ138DRAFT_1079491 [Hygrophoropsis aurantiaca]
MLAGSTSGLRLSSAQVPCRLLQAQQLFSQKQGAGVLQGRRCGHASHMIKRKEYIEEDASASASGAKASPVDCSPKNPTRLKRFTRPAGSIRPVYGYLHTSKPRDASLGSNAANVAQFGVTTLSDQQNTQDLPGGSVMVPIIELTGTYNRRKELLRILATTNSLADAWSAYSALLSMRPPEDHPANSPAIPYSHLHRLARLLASSKPRTRTLFLQLSSVLTTLQKSGGRTQLWEWNALVDCAGRSWRSTSLEDFKAALDVFSSITMSRSIHSNDSDDITEDHLASPPILTPDIVTYTTLLYIAGRSSHPAAIRHATSLLRSSGIPPNRLTHLALLGYFTRTNQLSGVRATLLKMKEQDLRVGLDGINACLWAYARNGHMDIAATIYRVLRNNVTPEIGIGEHDVDAAIIYLSHVEGIAVARDMIPDEITYTTMIQSLAYHGDLIRSLQVFVDMLSTPNMESFPLADDNGEHQRYQPTLAAFRGLFLGFVRHGHEPSKESKTSVLLSDRLSQSFDSSPESPWHLDNLHILFQTFMDMPGEVKPSERLIYWILVAFGRTSGNDAGKLRKIWSQLEHKFGGGWGGRLEKMRKSIHAEGADIRR